MVSLRTQAVTAPPPVPLIESEEGVDEEDPEEELHPHVGKHAGEVVVGTDVDLVV